MFRSCFVARVAAEKDRSVELFCNFTDPSEANSTAEALPPAQALGSFCFPLGPSNVKAKEYMAPEVPTVSFERLPLVSIQYTTCIQLKAIRPLIQSVTLCASL